MDEESKWLNVLKDIQLSSKAGGVIPIKEDFIDEYGKHCTRFTLPKDQPVSVFKPSDVIIKVNRKRKNLKFNFNN